MKAGFEKQRIPHTPITSLTSSEEGQSTTGWGQEDGERPPPIPGILSPTAAQTRQKTNHTPGILTKTFQHPRPHPKHKVKAQKFEADDNHSNNITKPQISDWPDSCA